MGKLDNLKKQFSPKRTYHDSYSDTTVEVDGSFVRVNEDWGDFNEQKNVLLSKVSDLSLRLPEEELLKELLDYLSRDTLEVPLEDLLPDVAVIRAARVSTGRDTKAVDEKAEGLIRSLYEGRHDTPFEGAAMFRLKVRTPICFAQPFFQLPYAHNEFSGRYSIIDGKFYTPSPPFAGDEQLIINNFLEAETDSLTTYKKLLDMGVAREQARFALLYRFYTEFYWTVSLRHLLELLALEHNHLTSFAFSGMKFSIFQQLLKDWAPWTYEKFQEIKRTIPTRWHEKELEHYQRNLGDALSRALASARLENIGNLFLLSCGDRSEELTSLGIQTKPNPRRGFGHGSMTFFAEVPIFVHRQWVRHRYGVWSELPVDFDKIVHTKDFYVPTLFRKQVGKAMSYQYEDMSSVENALVLEMIYGLIERSCQRYHQLRNQGFDQDQAAINLPYLFRIQTIWTANLESLMNFFSLRCDLHAQWETRQYANKIYEWFKDIYPLSNEIFLKHLNWGKSPLFQE